MEKKKDFDCPTSLTANKNRECAHFDASPSLRPFGGTTEIKEDFNVISRRVCEDGENGDVVVVQYYEFYNRKKLNACVNETTFEKALNNKLRLPVAQFHYLAKFGGISLAGGGQTVYTVSEDVFKNLLSECIKLSDNA